MEEQKPPDLAEGSVQQWANSAGLFTVCGRTVCIKNISVRLTDFKLADLHCIHTRMRLHM